MRIGMRFRESQEEEKHIFVFGEEKEISLQENEVEGMNSRHAIPLKLILQEERNETKKVGRKQRKREGKEECIFERKERKS